MAVYAFGNGGYSPLEMQLGAVPAGSYLKLKEASAAGEGTTGTVTNPILYRPTTVGTATVANQLFVTSVDNTSTSTSPIITTFNAAPSTPSVSGSAVDLPVRVRMVFPWNHEMIVYGGNAVVLYATASGGATWTGCMTWEER